MRKYRSTSGLTATMELVPCSRDQYRDEHVYTEVEGAGVRLSHRYNWHVSGDFSDAVDWLVREFGCGWIRER